MNWTLDRINRLRDHYGLSQLKLRSSFGQLHKFIDQIDHEAGMVTHGGYVRLGGHHRPVNPVGARLARHERRLEWAKNSYTFYHQLGAEADELVT